MKKKIIIGDTYEITLDSEKELSNEEIEKHVKKVMGIVKKEELNDSNDEPRLVTKEGKVVEEGDEVVSFRGEKAKVTGWQVPHKESSTGRVHVKWENDDGEMSYFPGVFDLKWINLPWQKVQEEVEDIKIEDIPVNAPEEEVNITYTEKLKGGKNALTYSMIETAFKDRNKDNGKTFKAYINVALDNLKEDIKDADLIVSGEMKSTRNLLLEDYVKIEHLIDKAGMKDVLSQFRPLVDELSDKLKLNKHKAPKFNKNTLQVASKELRNKHRYDAKTKGEQIAKVIAEAFAGECGPFGGENPIVQGNKVILHSQSGEEPWIFNDDGSVDSGYKDETEFMKSINYKPEEYGFEDEKDAIRFYNEIQHFDSVKDLFNSDLSWFMYIDDEEEILEKVNKILNGEVKEELTEDSKISHTMKPIFLCTKSELTASYNDAKEGKLPEVFEGNLEKVRKDMAADYDRINQGRDTYLEDPRIRETLPEIVNLYELALKYADDLEYTDYAKEFDYMLNTIKKGWGLAAE